MGEAARKIPMPGSPPHVDTPLGVQNKNVMAPNT